MPEKLLPALYALFATNEKGKHIINKKLTKFFNEATLEEEQLLREYLDPASVSHIGSSLNERARSAQHTRAQTSLSPLTVYIMCRDGDIVGNEAVAVLASLYSLLASDEIAVFETILLKKPVGFNYTTVNNFYVETYGVQFIEKFQVQLAAKYERMKNYKVDTFYATPKIDGLRCYYSAKHKRLFTRNNREHKGFEAVRSLCTIIANMFNLTYIDGELYSKDFKFQRLNGIIRQDEQILKKSIKYIIFAVTGPEIKNTEQMYATLEKIRTFITVEYAEVIEHKVIKNNYRDVAELAGFYVENGYEGIMLRHPTKHYDFKRSHALLKFKFFNEGDFKVVGTYEGENKYVGMLGGLYIESGNIKSKVGSGFSDEEREFLWACRDILIGRIVEVKYQELTDSGNSLRHPTFNKFK